MSGVPFDPDHAPISTIEQHLDCNTVVGNDQPFPLMAKA